MRRGRSIVALALVLLAVGVVAILRGTAGTPGRAPPPPTQAWQTNRAVEPDDPPPVLAADEGGYLRGMVLGTDGKPSAGSEVRALRDDALLARGVADADGAFRLGPLPSGDILLVARSGGLASEPLGPIPLAPDEELGGLVLHLVPGGSLAGTILDAATSAPLEGASVRAAGLASRTDAHGRFLLTGLAPGEVALQARAAGYQPWENLLSIGSGPSGDVEIRLTKGVQVAGRVVDGADRPVAGASLFTIVYRLDEPERLLAGRSGGDGTFEVAAPAGEVLVEAVDSRGGTGRTGVLSLVPGSRKEGVEIRLAEAASLVGNVLDASGEPLPGARVYATAGERTFGGAIAGRDGTFSIGGIPPGAIRVMAVSGGARAQVGPLEILEGETANVVLQLGLGVLRGVVVDGSSRTVSGARVSIWPEGSPRSLATVVLSDARGGFAAQGLPGGPLRVEATFEELHGERRGVSSSDAEVRVVLTGGVLSGLVLREGRPVTEFAIAASPLAPGAAGGTARSFVSTDGRFRLPLPAGEWEVRASAPAATGATARVVVPERGSSEVVLDLEAGGTIEGRVSSVSGEPLEGVRVSVQRDGVFAFARGPDVPGAPSSVTAADGSFRLAGVKPGRVPVFAFRPGLRFARPVVATVERGGIATVELRMEPGDSIGEESFGGIGLTLGANRERAVVAAEVIVGGPAFVAGVRRGDLIAGIDGAPLLAGTGLGHAAERIRGQVGSPVVLDLVREGTPFRVVAVRAELRY